MVVSHTNQGCGAVSLRCYDVTLVPVSSRNVYEAGVTYTLYTMSMQLSMQDRKDLEKFTKYLALRAAQIIVQSRSGQKVNTTCKSDSSAGDWFNLAIKELPEVSADAKRALCGEIVSSSVPLCIEISLKTVEGDKMVLETWSLGVLPEQSDPTVRVTYTVYNRMGILLKSLLSVSRTAPAYKLSRRQGPDSYTMCYRIYMGEPQLHNLGDNYKHMRVGQLCTPVGTIHLSVSYRTKMTISPTHKGRDSIMLKSDHFHSDLSPRHARYQQSEETSKSLSDTIKVGAFVINKPVIVNEEDLVIPDVPFRSLLTPKQTSPPPISLMDPTNTKTATAATVTDSNNGNNERLNNDNTTSKCASQNGSRRSSCSMTSANDDFIMVDLKTPFAVTNTNSDVGAFYRECQSAPQLQAFMEERTLAEQLGDLTKQLETFETNMQHYEDILSSLCQTENNN